MSKTVKRIITIASILIVTGLLVPAVKFSVYLTGWDKDGDGKSTDKDLALYTVTSDWFKDSDGWEPSSVVGKQVKWYSGKSDATIYSRGAFCIDNHVNSRYEDETGEDYIISDILDIDTASVYNANVAAGNSDWAGWPGGVINYSNNPSTVRWASSNAGAQNAVRLAYLATKSTQLGETSVDATGATGKYKRTIQYTFMYQVSDMINGLGMHPRLNTGDSQISWESYANECWYEAENYLNQVKSYKFEAMSTSPVVNILDGKSYIGPYKIKNVQGTIASVQVVDTNGTSYSVAGISDSVGGETKSITQIGNETTFYVVVGSEISSTVNVKIAKTFSGYKARIYFLRAGKQQDLAIFRGETTTLKNVISLPSAKQDSSKLRVIKQDTDTGAKLANVGFKIKNVDKNQYVKRNDTTISYVSESEAETIYTNEYGEFLVENLAPGEYQIYEVVNPNPGYLVDLANPNPASVTLTAGSQSDVTINNPYQIGSFELEKVDSEDSTIKLEGVEFTLKCTSGYYQGKYVGKDSSGNVTYNDSEVILTTGDDGKISLTDIWVGTYELVEINNPNYGYVVDSLNTTVVIKGHEKTSQVITNKQKYVKITGYIWEDVPYDIDKNAQRNDLYKNDNYDQNDIQLEGIVVRLKSKTTGKEVTDPVETKLDSETGEIGYKFLNVDVENVEDYYVEFEYDGLIYTSVDQLHFDLDNGSKAKEVVKLRNELDQKFTSVQPSTSDSVKTYDGNGNEAYEIKYDKDENNHISSIRDDNKCNLIATTEEAGYTITYERSSGEMKDTIENVNLGLYRRTQTDLALMEDMQEIKLEIKGYSHIYKYASRFDNMGVPSEDSWNVGVRFTDEYTKQVYKQPVYKADAAYDDVEYKQNNLKVNITYKIALRNEEEYPARINAIVNYYDNRYTVEQVGRGLNERGEITDIIEVPDAAKNYASYGKYNQMLVNTSSVLIQPHDVQYIYIQFSVANSHVLDILNLPESEEKNGYLDNISEIYSYTSYYKDGTTVRAAVDKDSIAGNAVPEDLKTYEDDTDASPAILLQTKEPEGGDEEGRIISGTVFEDEDPNQALKQGETRQGNGIYDSSEKGIAGVTVQLIETDGSGNIKKVDDGTGNLVDKVAQSYDETTGTWKPAEYVTKSGTENGVDVTGNYVIDGYTPGNYVLKYIWGDGAYKIVDGAQKEYEHMVENYKSTIYVDPELRDKMVDENGQIIDLGAQFYKKVTSERYSDALDDYNLRETIDTSFNKAQTSMGEEGYNHSINLEEVEKQKMNSYTNHMEFLIEYDDSGDLSITDGSTGSYIVDSMDFGITERPRQQLKVEKKVTSLKITLANGQNIVDATLNASGVLEGTYVTNVGPSVGADGKVEYNGFVKAEIDSELIQGSTVEMTYQFTIANESEADYHSKEFYYYGSGKERAEDIVKITPSRIVDYLDEKSIYKQGDALNIQYQWEALTLNQLKEGGDKAGLILNEIATGEDIKNVQIYQTEYMRQNNIKLSPRADAIGQAKESEDVSMTVNKVMSSSDDANFNNQVEIVLVNKDYGSQLTSTPGNYIPNQQNQETDDYTSQEVIVTPSTGGDRNYMLPMITLITSFVLLGVGIYLIIVKVMKRDLS